MQRVSQDVEDYIAGFDTEVRARLLAMRDIIRAEAPSAEESIAYGLVGYKLNRKPLVYFGGFKQHIGFYATPNGHDAFKDEFSKFKQGKGSVQFPLSQALPEQLVRRVVAYRVQTVSQANTLVSN